jgi:hypothetical protein
MSRVGIIIELCEILISDEINTTIFFLNLLRNVTELLLTVKDSEELHNLYSSPDIIRQVKSRRMRWAGHVARMGEETKVYKVLVGKPVGKRPLGVGGKMGSEWILGRLACGVWIGFG